MKKMWLMVLYYVNWSIDKSLTKGKGRATKKEDCFTFTVLCQSSQDAHRCLQWYFRHIYKTSHSLNIDDGVIHMSRMTIDSRGFHPHYLLLEGMREPIYLPDPNSNILRADRIFGYLR